MEHNWLNQRAQIPNNARLLQLARSNAALFSRCLRTAAVAKPSEFWNRKIELRPKTCSKIPSRCQHTTCAIRCPKRRVPKIPKSRGGWIPASAGMTERGNSYLSFPRRRESSRLVYTCCARVSRPCTHSRPKVSRHSTFTAVQIRETCGRRSRRGRETSAEPVGEDHRRTSVSAAAVAELTTANSSRSAAY